MSINLQSLTDDDFCYLTTTGRVTGRPHTIEIWFALHQTSLYMLSGGREQADWVKNIQRQPNVQVKIRAQIFQGQGRIVQEQEEDKLARFIVTEKYTPRTNEELQDWSITSLPIAIDLTF